MGNTSKAQLIMAVKIGCVRVVEDLLIDGENPDTMDKNGDTVLILAARHKHPKVIKKLLDAGANPKAKGNDGKDAWTISSDKSDPESQELLQEATMR